MYLFTLILACSAAIVIEESTSMMVTVPLLSLTKICILPLHHEYGLKNKKRFLISKFFLERKDSICGGILLHLLPRQNVSFSR
jgi:hypothetical protein